MSYLFVPHRDARYSRSVTCKIKYEQRNKTEDYRGLQ